MIPIEFLRQFRFGGYAIFDILVAFIGIYLLAPLLSKFFFKFRLVIPKRNWVFLTLPIGILFHLLFSKITPMTKDFLDLNGHYYLKILILILIIIGIKGISIKTKEILKNPLK